MNNSRTREATAEAVPESRTRERVLQAISQQGPITTTALADGLGLSDTAIRRHVDNLLADGLIEPHEATAGRRGRGRPARSYVVSAAGHRSLTSDYDHLATAAMHYLADALGPAAVEDFARHRVADWEARYAAQLAAPAGSPAASRSAASTTERVEALVAALTRDGFDASLRRVGGAGPASGLHGIQLCQGHCPVQGVAAQFPQLCEAETEAFSRLLGVHVQRLATLAHGDHVCTTFVPITPETTPPPTEAS